MQLLLSSYANWWTRRHRVGGHLFQGRYRTELVEDETYLWILTRYIHLNPVRAGMVPGPEQWAWSSYPGYAFRRCRFDWAAHEQLLAAWSGEFGRTDPEASYRRFVEAGISEPPQAPWTQARHNWILGSERFVDRLRIMIQGAEGDIVNCPSRLDKMGKEGLSGITCPVACQSRVTPRRRADSRPNVVVYPGQGFVAEVLRDIVVNYACWDRADRPTCGLRKTCR